MTNSGTPPFKVNFSISTSKIASEPKIERSTTNMNMTFNFKRNFIHFSSFFRIKGNKGFGMLTKYDRLLSCLTLPITSSVVLIGGLAVLDVLEI